MSEFIIEATIREELGKNANRRLRSRGRIPAVVYGRGQESQSLVVDPQEVLKVLHSRSGQNSIVSLKIGKKSRSALIRDFQMDPVKGNLVHTDFQTIALDQVMVFQVPVAARGSAAGVKMGGILDTPLREIEVECLPGDVPDHIGVDVSDLKIGQIVRVSELKIDRDKIKVLSDPEQIVVHVIPPTLPVEEEVEEEEAAEPEVIRKGRAEEEEGEEEQE